MSEAEKKAETKDERPRSFQDSAGYVWRPRLSTGVLIRISKELQLTVKKLSDVVSLIDTTEIAQYFDVLWITVEKQAVAAGITRDDFFDERLPASQLPEVVDVLLCVLKDAFPSLNLEIAKPPFARGR